MLHFDIDRHGLQKIGDELQGTEKQVRYALNRALRRTEASLRKLSIKGLTKELQLRTAQALRNRLKSIRVRQGKDGGVALWYGLNPLPASSFKGRADQDESGAWYGDYFFASSFVGRSNYKGRKTVFKRSGKGRLPIVEQGIKISDSAIVFIEDEVFVQTEQIFWAHFRRDLQARVRYQIGEA